MIVIGSGLAESVSIIRSTALLRGRPAAAGSRASPSVLACPFKNGGKLRRPSRGRRLPRATGMSMSPVSLRMRMALRAPGLTSAMPWTIVIASRLTSGALSR
jgi:hypothetical protein